MCCSTSLVGVFADTAGQLTLQQPHSDGESRFEWGGLNWSQGVVAISPLSPKVTLEVRQNHNTEM